MTIDTKEFRDLAMAWSDAATECDPPKTLSAWNSIVAHIDAQLVASRAAGLLAAAEIAKGCASGIGAEAAIRALATQARPTPAPTDCDHPRKTTTAMGAVTNTGWKCADCGKLLSEQDAPDRALPVSEQDERILPDGFTLAPVQMPEEMRQYLQDRLHSPVCKADVVWKHLLKMGLGMEDE